MQHCINIISNNSASFIIAESNFEVLRELNNMYKTTFVSTISKSTQDRTIIEAILKESFPQLREMRITFFQNAIQHHGVQIKKNAFISNPITN